MSKHARTTPTVRLAAVAGVSTALLFPAVGLTAAAPALAHSESEQSQDGSTLGERAVEEAARHAGKPYEYGATGPDSFDCSGFTQYVYGQVGVEVPRTSRDQYAASEKVAQADKQPGDLIAMRNSEGRVTHVGIYAGDESWWVASSSKDEITLQSLYSDNYGVGRFS